MHCCSPVCCETCSADPLCTDGLRWRRCLKLSPDTVWWGIYLVFSRHTVKGESRSEGANSSSTVRQSHRFRFGLRCLPVLTAELVFFNFSQQTEMLLTPEAQSLIVVIGAYPGYRRSLHPGFHNGQSCCQEASCITCCRGRRVSIFYPTSFRRRVALLLRQQRTSLCSSLSFQPHIGPAVHRGPSLATSSQSLNETHVGTVDKCTSDGVQ